MKPTARPQDDISQTGGVDAVGITLTLQAQAGERAVSSLGLAREGTIQPDPGINWRQASVVATVRMRPPRGSKTRATVRGSAVGGSGKK